MSATLKNFGDLDFYLKFQAKKVYFHGIKRRKKEKAQPNLADFVFKLLPITY